jgi:hypothetical protein
MIITAAGANTYQWLNNGFIKNLSQASAIVFPLTDKFYAVEAHQYIRLQGTGFSPGKGDQTI